MRRIKNNNYYVTNGWMINELGLSGRELQVYAIIYGFTQDEESEFNGSLNYIAEWLGTSNKVTVTRALNSLIEKGYITKRQTTAKGVKTNYYRAVLPYPRKEKSSTGTVPGVVPERYRGSTETVPGGSTETVPGGSTETVPNIYITNYKNKDIDNLLVEKEEKSDPVPYSKIKDLYNSTCHSLSKVVALSERRKKAISARWKEYGEDIAIFEKLFTMAEESTFLKGGNDRNWTATFDWLLNQNNMTKVLEGNYKNKGAARNATRISDRTDNGKKRAITTEELEDKLRREGSFKGYPDFDKMFGKAGKA